MSKTQTEPDCPSPKLLSNATHRKRYECKCATDLFIAIIYLMLSVSLRLKGHIKRVALFMIWNDKSHDIFYFKGLVMVRRRSQPPQRTHLFDDIASFFPFNDDNTDDDVFHNNDGWSWSRASGFELRGRPWSPRLQSQRRVCAGPG